MGKPHTHTHTHTHTGIGTRTLLGVRIRGIILHNLLFPRYRQNYHVPHLFFFPFNFRVEHQVQFIESLLLISMTSDGDERG